MKFLIVDDSKVSREKISKILIQLGYEVVGEAKDGLEALRKTKELSPTFITMDFEMPNMKGDEASKKILALFPNVKIIVITSVVNKRELHNMHEIGVKKILKKPITKESLDLALLEFKK
ncbi:response regulator [Halarcobacter ebronensis]|uniref:Two-component system response regulator n=1 Tax=Halarcobacter ebronensis TaxID=1462615 RepID=A0A4Q1AQ88_9BACT|nr:response regulator [Halarcobacter ebronensis]QKF81518.1 CheY-like response regulator [Halarcobacter ebronensis]RXK05448.1 two-component system response regulator [Halarcobacter ebronensis]